MNAYVDAKSRLGDQVRFALTLPADPGAVRRPDRSQFAALQAQLTQAGVTVRSIGQHSLTAACHWALYEQLFGTRLSEWTLPPERGRNRQAYRFMFPAPGAPWAPQDWILRGVGEAYIQWPHTYMSVLFPNGTTALPPDVPGHALRVPGDVAMLLNATAGHRAGITGRGVRVAMIDTGFAHDHAHFTAHGHRARVVLAAGASDRETDDNGHGTAQSANLFAVAPDVECVGVKLDNSASPGDGASLIEGFHAAMQCDPQVISVSIGYDLCPTDVATGRRLSDDPLATLPNSLRALEAEIRAIVATGVVVVVAAGNGQVAFPAMMPEVIAAGGVHVDRAGTLRASDYASAFPGLIYPGRTVPDCAGLVGLADNRAQYILLPVAPGSEVDGRPDGTRPGDGWAVLSGTSAAAPQIAGVCALLLQKNRGLSAAEIRTILRQTARPVVLGAANPDSNGGRSVPARASADGAAGAGLVDAGAALAAV